MAPEMIMDQKSAGLPADIWAIGAILYQLIAGVLPYGRGLGAAPRIVNAGLPPKPSLFGAKPQFSPLTEDLWNIVTMCLQKKPEERPTADQLIDLCARLCYSDAPRLTGVIDIWKYNAWGFIAGGAGETVFFHGDSFYGSKVQVGQKVNVAQFPGAPCARAFPVLPLRDPAIP
jgi:eukaryotic-like serine/threonine-protein kinase